LNGAGPVLPDGLRRFLCDNVISHSALLNDMDITRGIRQKRANKKRPESGTVPWRQQTGGHAPA
jgi:hypothetical protein